MRRIVVLALIGCSLWLPTATAQEKIPALVFVPETLAGAERTKFSAQRNALQSQLAAFQTAAHAFNDKPAENQTDAEFNAVQAQRSEYIRAAKAFNEALSAAIATTSAPPTQVNPNDCSEAEHQAEADRQEIERLVKVREMNQEELETWSRLNAKAQQEAVVASVKFVLGTVSLGAEQVRGSTTALQEKAEVLAKNALRSRKAANKAKYVARLVELNAELKPLNDKLLLQTIADKSVGAYDLWTVSQNTMQHEFRRAAHTNENVRALLRDPGFREAFAGDEVDTPGLDVMTQLTESAINETATFADSVGHYNLLVAETVNAATFCRDASYNALLSYLSTKRVGQQNDLAGELARSSKVLQQKYKRSIDRLHTCRTSGPP